MNIDSTDYRCPELNVAKSHSIDAILDQIQKTNSKTITNDASFKNWRGDTLRYRNKLLNKLLKAYSDYKTESYREMKHHRNVFFRVMTLLLLIHIVGLPAGFIL